MNSPVCQKRREGFSLSGGRITKEEGKKEEGILGACGAILFVIPLAKARNKD
jgi:hypothetical protein